MFLSDAVAQSGEGGEQAVAKQRRPALLQQPVRGATPTTPNKKGRDSGDREKRKDSATM